jgi:hypothetical protein
MPLVRGHHAFDDQFVQIPNAWMRDNRLSLKARGLIAQIMTHRENWSLSINRLALDNNEGKHAIRQAIAELEKFGYLVRDQVNDKRFAEAIWTTRDPFEIPLSENPLSEIPLSENRTTKNNNLLEEQLIEENTKNTTKRDLFDEFWSEYPRKVDRAKAVRAFKSALNRTSFEEILAGAIAYRNDTNRKPEFTKYPATWLNSDSWENEILPSPDSEAAERAKLRREREKAATEQFLAEQRRLEESVKPPVLCNHGKTIALCLPCSKDLDA